MKKNKRNQQIPYNYIYTLENPMTFITEEYQKTLVNFEFINVDNKYQVIQITSSLQSEGKTTFVSNFASLLAQKKKRVLLIDLDLRRPKIHRVFDQMNDIGLTDILLGNATLQDALIKTEKSTIDLLLSGQKTTTVINILESEKLRQIIQELKTLYDYILIDSPPVIAVSDALYISKLCDGVLFIMEHDKTKKNIIKEAISTLTKNAVPILGTVLVQVDLKRNLYSYGYGYTYYESND